MNYKNYGTIYDVRKKSNKYVFLVVLLFAFLLLFLFRFPLLVKAGNILIAEDSPEKADIIVVLMGSIPDRVVQGVDLYGEGYGENIVMVRSHFFSSDELVEELALKVFDSVDINRDIALQLGVPKRSVLVLEASADSTWDEAVAVKDFMEERGKESILLVTSRYHSARAKKTFEKVLGNGYKVISAPSKYDPFDPNEWWKHRRQARNVLFEYQKFLNLYLFKR